jgi:hypothetical protein
VLAVTVTLVVCVSQCASARLTPATVKTAIRTIASHPENRTNHGLRRNSPNAYMTPHPHSAAARRRCELPRRYSCFARGTRSVRARNKPLAQAARTKRSGARTRPKRQRRQPGYPAHVRVSVGSCAPYNLALSRSPRVPVKEISEGRRDPEKFGLSRTIFDACEPLWLSFPARGAPQLSTDRDQTTARPAVDQVNCRCRAPSPRTMYLGRNIGRTQMRNAED